MEYKDLHVDRGDHYDAVLAGSAFDNYMTHWEVVRVRELINARFPAGVGRYLDFACGTGRMTQVIGEYASEVVGVDVSDTMLATARSKVPGARFVKADLTTESVDLGMFDMVSSFRFFGNAEPGLRAAVLKELSPRVKPGGYLLVNNHRNPLAFISLFDRLGRGTMEVDLTHRRFVKLLRTAGFEVSALRPIAVWQFRHALAAKAGGNPHREAMLERLFSSGAWAAIAPDTVILARKVGPPA